MIYALGRYAPSVAERRSLQSVEDRPLGVAPLRSALTLRADSARSVEVGPGTLRSAPLRYAPSVGATADPPLRSAPL